VRPPPLPSSVKIAKWLRVHSRRIKRSSGHGGGGGPLINQDQSRSSVHVDRPSIVWFTIFCNRHFYPWRVNENERERTTRERRSENEATRRMSARAGIFCRTHTHVIYKHFFFFVYLFSTHTHTYIYIYLYIIPEGPRYYKPKL